jgi:uncharacterized membrane protein (UPF0127 family)
LLPQGILTESRLQPHSQNLLRLSGAAIVFLNLTTFWGCASATDAEKKNDLSKMRTATIRVKGQPFEVWLAQTPSEQELGLMQTTEDQLAPIDGRRRGMLFLFPNEHILSFWMHNTIIPLDIAYIRGDGAIVRTYTMPPLEDRLFPSVEPALMALEVKAGTWSELGVQPGDRVEIPESLLKPPG